MRRSRGERIIVVPVIRGIRPPAAETRRESRMSNEELVRHVADELHWDPKVDSAAIAVSADDGAVTLPARSQLHGEREAKADAERVYGVKDRQERSRRADPHGSPAQRRRHPRGACFRHWTLDSPRCRRAS
jgi:hypothetical protein